MKLIVFVRSCATISFALVTSAAESFLDREFLVETAGVRSVVTLNDGKILIGGSLDSVNGFPRPSHLARLNSNGTLDLAYNPQVANDSIDSMEKGSDGTILVLTGDRHLLRLNPDGTPDVAFNCSAQGIYCSGRLPDGKIIIGGAFTLIDGKQKTYLARLNVDGSLDDAYAAAVPSFIVTSLLPQADGKVIIGGPFQTVGGTLRIGVARLDQNGNLDIGFNLGGQALPNGERALAITRFSDGGILVGGQAALYRLSSSGVKDASFPSSRPEGGNFGAVREVDGQIYVGGNLTIEGKLRGLFRLSATGARDVAFDPDFGTGIPFVTAIDVHPDGILIAGTFNSIDGDLRFGIARFKRIVTEAVPQLDIRRAPVVLLSGIMGSSYRIDFSTSVPSNAWSPLTNFTLNSAQFQVVDLEDVSQTRFYRAVPLP